MTAPYLDAGGEISYNGYTFYGPRRNVDVSIRPVMDSTGRYVTHSIFNYTVEAWINADLTGQSTGVYNGLDVTSHIETIRGALSQSGGALTISGFGLGNITVNTTSSNYDVGWGPHTRDLKLRAIGGCLVAVIWHVEVAVKVCPAGTTQGILGTLKEYSYSVQYSINPNGATVKSVTGRLEIFNNQSPTNRARTGLYQTADDYRHLVKVQPIPGFVRKQPQTYRLSENGCVLEFSVTDSERVGESAYPPGVEDIRFYHTASTSMTGSAGGFTGQEASISGTVRMALPFTVSYGMEKVLLLIQERLAHAANQGGQVIINTFRVTESVYERELSFSLDYWILNNKGSLKTFLTTSGLFTRFNSTDDNTYQQSMQLAWDQRGAQGLVHDPSSNRLIDPCVTRNPSIVIKEKRSTGSRSQTLAKLVTECPKKEKSYVIYENKIDWSFTNTVHVISQMPTSSRTSPGQTGVTISGMNLPVDGTSARHQTVQTTGDSQPKVEITIRGRAYRIGYEIENPKALSILGANLNIVPGTQEFENEIVYYYNGVCPVYGGTWCCTYSVQFGSVSQMQAAFQQGISAVLFETPDVTNPKDKVGN